MAVGPTILEGIDHGLRRGALVEVLIGEIFRGQLRPGEHLVTRSLAERYGVSHTPIREALISLAGVGVVDLLPNRGAIVRLVTPIEVREIGQVRRALEVEAVRGACGRIDPGVLTSLRESLLDLDRSDPTPLAERVDSARDVDSRLHDAIAAASGNAFLARELGRLKVLFRAFRDATWELEAIRHDPRRLREESAEHLAIVEALLSRDCRRASFAMSRHILSGRRYWCRLMIGPGRPARPEGRPLA